MFTAFAAAAGAGHLGLKWLSENYDWAWLSSPFVTAVVTTSLWVAGIAVLGAVLTAGAAVYRAVNLMANADMPPYAIEQYQFELLRIERRLREDAERWEKTLGLFGQLRRDFRLGEL